MYMLDTNIIIFCIRHPDSACAQTLAEHVGKDVCISVVTYAELMFGVYNSKQPGQNLAALRLFLSGIRILEFDSAAAVHFGQILADHAKKKADRPGHDRDKMIAAHARSLGFTLITPSSHPTTGSQAFRPPADLHTMRSP